jgi:two-component system invasion response regulator UvrY
MKVLIVDDHTVVRQGLKEIIKEIDQVSLIDEAKDGREALDKLESCDYNLVILDISMPGKNGLGVLEVLKNRCKKVQILVLSMHPQEQYAVHAFKLGASGYLSKDSAYTELKLAISKISEGGKYISSEFAEKLIFEQTPEQGIRPHEKLSEREFQVLCLLARGISVTEIGNELCISNKTVSTYRSRILEKMGLKKNAELTLYAIKNGIIE